MENRVNYTLVGLFFVAVVSALGGFMWWMISYGNDAGGYRSYYILTDDLPSGIKQDSQVKFIGVDAGVVKNIKFSNPKEAIIELELWVKKDLPIKKDSTAVTEIQGITGISYLNIQRGSKDSKGFGDEEKAYIKLEENLLQKIGGKASDITEKVEETLLNLNKILNNENADKIASILNSADNIMKKIDAQNIDINAVLVNANDTIKEAKKFIVSLQGTLAHANLALQKAGGSADEFKKAQQMFQSKIANGEFDLKGTISSVSSEATTTLLELQKTLKEFRATLFRLEDKPYEFFFKDPKDKDDR